MPFLLTGLRSYRRNTNREGQLILGRQEEVICGHADDGDRTEFRDIFAYALARTSGEPLLFKGDDFARTDSARVI
jgi:hypothetical protein